VTSLTASVSATSVVESNNVELVAATLGTTEHALDVGSGGTDDLGYLVHRNMITGPPDTNGLVV
jgi:hypothetical protein